MKYLYLACESYATPWIEGGEVPLFYASRYQSVERAGVMTPDENRKLVCRGLTHEQVEFMSRVFPGNPLEVHSRYVLFPGNVFASNVHLELDQWDGIVLCLSNVECREICRRLGKVTCVGIEDVDYMFNQISEQLKERFNLEGFRENCDYADDPNRGVFLKGIDDQWQQEYRMFWPHQVEGAKEAKIPVMIRPGTGRKLWTLETHEQEPSLATTPCSVDR